MKLIAALSFLSLTTCAIIHQPADDIYYIYIKPGDAKFRKEIRKGGFSIQYTCGCYARKNDLEFTHADSSESFDKKTIPSKTYSMEEFAELANKARAKFKNLELVRTKTYIIEKLTDGSYQFNKVRFYTIEGDE